MPDCISNHPRPVAALVALAAFLFVLVLPPAQQPDYGEAVKLSAAELKELICNPVGKTTFKSFAVKPATERWHNVTGRAVDESFRQDFSYKKAEVQVSYCRLGGTFVGRLTAKKLKPHFAYQVKLQGNYERDSSSHRRLGYTGRWRLPESGTNFTDYEAEKYSDRSKVEGYILFDYFVTDEEGAADCVLKLESSLHVIWSSLLNEKDFDHMTDTLIRRFTVDDITFQLGAENQRRWSNFRPRPGKAKLPAGRYDCDLVITEESFHLNGGGYWATVMGGPVKFIIMH